MPNRTCIRCGAIFTAPNGSRGQWRRYCGQACANTPRPAPSLPTCTIVGCTKAANRLSRTICEMHYGRLRRSGTLDARPQRAARETCTVPECGEPDKGPHGLCAKHYTRLQRHGSTDVVLKAPPQRAAESPTWKGDDVGYRAVHVRLRTERGPAAAHPCVDCYGRAAHWSYDHADPDEKQSSHGHYSTDPEHYQPRCVSCHKRFDLDFLAA